MRRLTQLLAVVLPLTGCVAPDLYRRARPPEAKQITVLVPGYRGSFLYAGDEIRYLTAGQALTRGDQPLASCEGGPLPLTHGGPLTSYNVAGYRVDVYSPVMEWGERRLPGFTAFGYDWREDLFATAKKLCDFIGDRRANVIAHSMGGLVALLAEEQCGDRFDAVVFAAVPFGGAPGLLYDLFNGSRVRMNTTLLGAPVLWSFPSTWQLLPRADDFFVDRGGATKQIDLSAKQTWGKWPVPCPQRLDERLADRARIPLKLGAPRARALTVIGRGNPTCAAVRLTEAGELDPKPPTADGDGAVPLDRAQPPFASQKLYTRHSHAEVLNDPFVLEAIGRFLEARPRAVSP